MAWQANNEFVNRAFQQNVFEFWTDSTLDLPQVDSERERASERNSKNEGRSPETSDVKSQEASDKVANYLI